MRVACISIGGDASCAAVQGFAQACFRFSPQVSLCGETYVFIEIGKCHLLYTEARFKVRVAVLAKRFHLKVSVSVADHLPWSLVFVKYQVSQISQAPLEALCDLADPLKGSHHRAETEDVVMQSHEIVDALKRLGLQNLADFQCLPRRQVISRFGYLGLILRERVDGLMSFPWPLWVPPHHFQESVDFLPEEGVYGMEALLFCAKSILDRLFSQMKGRRLRADVMRVTLYFKRSTSLAHGENRRDWSFHFTVPQGGSAGFLPLLRERWQRDLETKPLDGELQSMEIEVLQTSPGRSQQVGFYEEEAEKEERLGSFFGQMEELLGKQNVFWAQATENRFPERSWQRVRQFPVKEGVVDLRGRYPQRPTRLLQKPVPLRFSGSEVYVGKRRFLIQQWSAVERLSAGWIDEEESRNYYHLYLSQGGALFVFSDASHDFFLHGYFE